MSPTSRGRRPKKKPTGPRRSRRDDDAPFAVMLREIGAELAEATDALDAELAVSWLAGSWRDLEYGGADTEVEVGDRLVAYAAGRRTSRPALALLRVVAELGTPAQREAASGGADALAAAGAPEPVWAEDLRTVRHTGSWAYGDVFGDQTSVLLAFDRPGRPHGTVVLVDHTLGGIAKDAFVVDDVTATLGDIRAQVGDLMWVRELAAAEAAALLVPAFAATDADRDLPLGDDLRDTRALVVARLRLLPEPPAVLPHRPEDPAPVAEEFLASGARRDVDGDADAVEACARLVARLMAEIDGQPGRVSPAKLELLLDEHLPEALGDDDPTWDVLPTVLPAWVAWAAERAGLAPSARAALAEDVDALLDDEGADIPDELVDALLDDVPEDVTPEELSQILARRTFAVGGPLIVDDGELILDPADPDQRALAIQREHPEYAAALEDLLDDRLVDGVNPRLHLTLHEVVANQLWDGEPAGVWPAALRLFAAGVDRHDVLHALADVAAHHVHTALQERRPYDAAAYAADLDALGAEAARRH